MQLYLIRHGKTQGNQEKRYIGRSDEPLCREGRWEILHKKEEGVYRGIEKTEFLFVSPRKRCIQTAELLLPGQEPVSLSHFREIDFGEFEGKNYQELSGNARYQEWIDSGGTLPFPGGESRQQFIERCCHGMKQVADYLKERGADRAVLTLVVHGGTVMSLLSTLGQDAGDYYDYQCENAGGYLCEFLPERHKPLQIIRNL